MSDPLASRAMSSASTALLFPGQGSQTATMRNDVATHAPELLELAMAAAGDDPFELADTGTAYAQPAILSASLAAYAAAGRPWAHFFAGHSLGELSSLAAAGAIEPADAVRLAAIRGRLMQQAGEQSPGGMVALIGDRGGAEAAAAAGGTVIANDNGPKQVVAAGPPEALEATAREAEGRGVRALKLAVTAAFHTEAMAPAEAPFREALAEVEFREPQTTVLASSSAAPFPGDAEGIREQLAFSIVHPVRWRETLDAMYAAGVRRFVETGPGKGLIGMVRRAYDEVETTTLSAEARG